MQLNRRHKVGLFLTIIIVGTGLVLDAGVKESVGIGLLGLAATWLIGSVRLKRKETSQIPETPAAGQVPEQALTPKEGQHTETSHAAVRASHEGSWAWMIVSTLILLALLGLAIFNMTWQSMAGEAEKAGESLGNAHPTDRSWICRKEHKELSAFKRADGQSRVQEQASTVQCDSGDLQHRSFARGPRIWCGCGKQNRQK